MITNYPFTKAVQTLQLENEIKASAIVTAIQSIVLNGTSDLVVSFKDALSGGDETILNNLVAAHVPVAIVIAPEVVQVSSLPEPQPFAQPTYRTKRDATPTWVDCPENADTPVDFLMAQERYVSGGGIIIKDAKEGDWISAEVMDVNGVIPVPYRAALCEAHPIVAQYIPRRWIVPQDGYREFEIDTYPLNAKISAGLVLRITYHSSAIAGVRKIAVNYHLTKKL